MEAMKSWEFLVGVREKRLWGDLEINLKKEEETFRVRASYLPKEGYSPEDFQEKEK